MTSPESVPEESQSSAPNVSPSPESAGLPPVVRQPSPGRPGRAGTSGRELTDPAEQESQTVTPNSLRVGASIGRELFGDQYDAERGISAHGPAAFGDHNTINYAVSRRPVPVTAALHHVPTLMRVYEPAQSDIELDRILEHRQSVCLIGPPGTGRFSSACAAMARRHGAEHVHEILLPNDADVEGTDWSAVPIESRSGYVLRLAGNGHSQAMRRLEGIFVTKSASLLLIRNEGARREELHGAEVRHVRSDNAGMFRRHLNDLINQNTLDATDNGSYADTCLTNERLQSILRQTYGPREIVSIAEAVFLRAPHDDASMESALAASQPNRRDRAIRILMPERSPQAPRQRRAAQYERAFRIAYAVFCHQPLNYVFDTTGLLMSQIDGESGRPDIGRLALEHSVPELLGPELAADWRDAQEPNPNQAGSRTAWLRDAGMRGAIIDVAWHEFDHTRPALIRWLDKMVDSADIQMQRAAAETAGLLADRDFRSVRQDLIDKWAQSKRATVRQVAAWSAVIAAQGGRVGHDVRSMIRVWIASSATQRDTAARVYASGLLQPHAAWTMSDLRRVALDPMQTLRGTVVEGIYQLAATVPSGWILAELARWVDSGGSKPLTATHAARSMVVLAERPYGGDIANAPDLLVRLASEDVELSDLIRLWHVALLDPRSANRAWAALGTWVRHADTDSRLRAVTAALIRTLASDQIFRRRLTFYLGRQLQDVPGWAAASMKGADL